MVNMDPRGDRLPVNPPVYICDCIFEQSQTFLARARVRMHESRVGRPKLVFLLPQLYRIPKLREGVGGREEGYTGGNSNPERKAKSSK